MCNHTVDFSITMQATRLQRQRRQDVVRFWGNLLVAASAAVAGVLVYQVRSRAAHVYAASAVQQHHQVKADETMLKQCDVLWARGAFHPLPALFTGWHQ